MSTHVRRSTGSLHIANQEGRTPLMVAASKGRQDIAKQLLAAGAFINLQVSFHNRVTQLPTKKILCFANMQRAVCVVQFQCKHFVYLCVEFTGWSSDDYEERYFCVYDF